MREGNRDMFIVMFKLETDSKIINKKVLSSMLRYKVNLTIGNLLQSHKTNVSLFTLDQETKDLKEKKLVKEKGKDLESDIIENLDAIFNQYLK